MVIVNYVKYSDGGTMGVFWAENRKKGEKTGRQRENNGGAGDFFCAARMGKDRKLTARTLHRTGGAVYNGFFRIKL